MRINYPKLVFAAAAFLYFIWVAKNPAEWSFLDFIDLPVHETGHLLFRPFGEFIMVAGGSIFQVVLPLVFVGYFVWQKNFYAAAIVLFWVGQSLLNVFVYANDAVVMQLPLTSGTTGSEGGFHDWNYMLDRFNMLDSTRAVAGVIRFAGTLFIIAAGILSIKFSIFPEKEI